MAEPGESRAAGGHTLTCADACMHCSLKAQVTASDPQLGVRNLLGCSRLARVSEGKRLT